ncbi:hypothetical protein SDC9_173140 [bioreactor metagenome]|uniref:Uncharacterized protein n=1 Tax=bioreactor metagenome TaxID=1076179 RepID=A0A645GHR4_9ZZZZ
MHETDKEHRDAAGNDPAPPRGTILQSVRDCVADERDESARDGPKQRREERAETVCRLDGCFGDAARHLHIHEQQREQRRAEAGCDDGLGRNLKHFLHLTIPPIFSFWFRL